MGAIAPDRAAENDDSHHAGSANHLTVGVAAEDLVQQSGLEPVDLLARIAEPGRHDESAITELEAPRC